MILAALPSLTKFIGLHLDGVAKDSQSTLARFALGEAAAPAADDALDSGPNGFDQMLEVAATLPQLRALSVGGNTFSLATRTVTSLTAVLSAAPKLTELYVSADGGTRLREALPSLLRAI
eukprot:2695736-Pleurochrysis_carterae.AAC.1